MYGLTKENTRRTMELRYNYPFSTVDHESAPWGHVRYIPEEYILHNCLEIYVLLVVTAQTEFCFERHGVRKPPLNTLFDGITRRVYEVIQEFQIEDISRICDREVFLEYFKKAFVVSLVWCGF
jgi:hypothetical protein